MRLTRRLETIERAAGVNGHVPRCDACGALLPVRYPAELSPLPVTPALRLCYDCFPLFQLAQELAREAAWLPCRGEGCRHRQPSWETCGRCYGRDEARYWRLLSEYAHRLTELARASAACRETLRQIERALVAFASGRLDVPPTWRAETLRELGEMLGLDGDGGGEQP